MKIAPHLVVGLTFAAALSAGAILAAEDRALFDPQQATLMVMTEDAGTATRAVNVPSDGSGRRPVVLRRPQH